jgi:hypothetical protein
MDDLNLDQDELGEEEEPTTSDDDFIVSDPDDDEADMDTLGEQIPQDEELCSEVSLSPILDHHPCSTSFLQEESEAVATEGGTDNTSLVDDTSVSLTPPFCYRKY